jgi:hypothetical protein
MIHCGSGPPGFAVPRTTDSTPAISADRPAAKMSTSCDGTNCSIWSIRMQSHSDPRYLPSSPTSFACPNCRMLPFPQST